MNINSATFHNVARLVIRWSTRPAYGLQADQRGAKRGARVELMEISVWQATEYRVGVMVMTKYEGKKVTACGF